MIFLVAARKPVGRSVTNTSESSGVPMAMDYNGHWLGILFCRLMSHGGTSVHLPSFRVYGLGFGAQG